MNRMWIAWQRFYATAAASTPSTVRVPSGGVVCEWNCVFVTANQVLVHAVRDVFRNMQLSYEGTNVHILPETADIPASLRVEDATEGVFPMFVSAEDWLLMLDVTVCCDDIADLKTRCDTSIDAHTYAVEERVRLYETLARAERTYLASKAELEAQHLMPSELSNALNQHQAIRSDADRQRV